MKCQSFRNFWSQIHVSRLIYLDHVFPRKRPEEKNTIFPQLKTMSLRHLFLQVTALWHRKIIKWISSILLIEWGQHPLGWKRENNCPGFSQDRVNFHPNPGRATKPGQTEQGIPYHVPSCCVLGGGAQRWELTRGSGARSGGCSGRAALFCGLCSAGLFCVFPFSVPLLFLFPLFAVLLNCPYPDPPVFACFFPFSSAPQWGEGRPRGVYVAGRGQTITITCNYVVTGCISGAFCNSRIFDFWRLTSPLR